MKRLGDMLARIARAERLFSIQTSESLAITVSDGNARKEAEKAFVRWRLEAASKFKAGENPAPFSVGCWTEGEEHFLISDAKHRDFDLFIALNRWVNAYGMQLVANGKSISTSDAPISVISVAAHPQPRLASKAAAAPTIFKPTAA
jgi:hypothetical protein